METPTEPTGPPLPNPLRRAQVGDSPMAGAMFRLQCAVDELNDATLAILETGKLASTLRFVAVSSDVAYSNRRDPFHLQHVCAKPAAFVSVGDGAEREGGANS